MIIGVDVGTTAVKVAAFGIDAGTGARAAAQQEYPLDQPEPGWQVQNPRILLAAVDQALAEVVADLDGCEVLGLSVSTAMHGLVGLDERFRPQTPVITWADSRAGTEAAWLRANGGVELLHRSGTPVHAMSPLSKLMWFSRNEPDQAARISWWASLKDLVLHHLTDQLVTDLSIASGTGLLDVHTRTWHPAALELAGITADQVPEVLATTTVLELSAAAAARVGLTGGVPVVIGAADGPLGNLGTGAIVPGVAGLSVGTSGAVRMAVPEPTFDAAGRLFCYALTDDLWVSGGAVSNGGIAMRWAGEVFAPALAAEPDADAALLARAARVPAGSDGLVMLPYLLSERAPLDPDLPGAYLGVRRHHTADHFIRATLEGVCLQIASITDALEEVGPVTAIRATGTPFRSGLWRTVMAAVTDRPLTVASDTGGTALGAAALAAYALGVRDNLPAALAAVGGPNPSARPGQDTILVATAEVATYRAAREQLRLLLTAYLDATVPGAPPTQR